MQICIPLWIQGRWRQVLEETKPTAEGLILEGFPRARQQAIRDRILAGLGESTRGRLVDVGVRLTLAPPTRAGPLFHLDDVLIELASAVAHSAQPVASGH